MMASHSRGSSLQASVRQQGHHSPLVGYSNIRLDTEVRTKPGLRMVGTFGIRSLCEGYTGYRDETGGIGELF